MLPLLATLWITSTAAPLDELEVPSWPSDLHAERRDGGVFLPAPTADALHRRLEWCDRLPALARSITDTRVNEATAIQEELHQVDLAQQATRLDKLERERWSTLQRVGAVLSGGIVGAAIGLVVAVVIR